jgi:hypothetical protein
VPKVESTPGGMSSPTARRRPSRSSASSSICGSTSGTRGSRSWWCGASSTRVRQTVSPNVAWSPAIRFITPACTSGRSSKAIRPLCRRTSCSVLRASDASVSGPLGRGLCNQRKRLSATRGSEIAHSRRPRSISASLGGSRERRVARTGPVGLCGASGPAGVPEPASSFPSLARSG